MFRSRQSGKIHGVILAVCSLFLLNNVQVLLRGWGFSAVEAVSLVTICVNHGATRLLFSSFR